MSDRNVVRERAVDALFHARRKHQCREAWLYFWAT